MVMIIVMIKMIITTNYNQIVMIMAQVESSFSVDGEEGADDIDDLFE